MLDPRTKEEKQAAAKKCYDSLTANGRRSCAGCHLDFYCPMLQATSVWLFTQFLPAIDPTGLVFGCPATTQASSDPTRDGASPKG